MVFVQQPWSTLPVTLLPQSWPQAMELESGKWLQMEVKERCRGPKGSAEDGRDPHDRKNTANMLIEATAGQRVVISKLSWELVSDGIRT